MLPFLPERQAAKTSEELSPSASICSDSALQITKDGFSKAVKSGGACRNFGETPPYFATRAGGAGTGLSESRVRALCHPPAAATAWGQSPAPHALPQGSSARVLPEYGVRALRWQHQTALRAASAALGRQGQNRRGLRGSSD